MHTTRLKKSGAGMLLTSNGEMLLLLRGAESGHPNTWGLPGGNADEGETAIATALRETSEELGQHVPNYSIKSEIVTLRGKKLDKQFVIFVAEISPLDRASFVPALNDEHIGYRWFKMSDIPGIPNLHPIVKTVFKDHSQQLSDAIAS